MPNLHRLYKAGAATIVHAAATPYRERSHFDGQDVLESGLAAPGRADTGWLNRALGALRAGRARATARGEAFAVGPITPLVVRGPAPVLSWTPPRLPPASDDTADAAARSLSPHRSGACARAGGAHGACRRSRAPAAWMRCRARTRSRAAARRRCAPISRKRPAPRRNSWRGRTDRASARSPSTAGTRTPTKARSSGRLATLLGALDGAIAAIETEMGDGVERDRGRGDHRVRPHRAHQRHRRHRPRHRRRSRCSRAARSRAAA